MKHRLRHIYSWATRDSQRRVLTSAFLRVVSTGCTIASGAGIGDAQPSNFRIAAGSSSSLSTVFQLICGSKRMGQYIPPSLAFKFTLGCSLAASSMLIASGLTTEGRMSEAALGAWIASAKLIMLFGRERAGLNPESVIPENIYQRLKHYKDSPVSIGADMTALSSLLVVFEASVAQVIAEQPIDEFRTATGLILIASNWVLRGVRKNDFDRQAPKP